MANDRRSAEELAALISHLRKASGLSGSELARRLGPGFSQSKISRLQAGILTPSPMDAGRIGWELRNVASRAERRRLIELAQDVVQERSGAYRVRVVLSHGSARLQREIGERIERANRLATFHPVLVPGMLQTDGYMRSITASSPAPLSPRRVERWLTERKRQQRSRMGRPSVQLLTEGALSWGVAGAQVMAEQCEYIAGLIDTAHGWEIGVIPRHMQLSRGFPIAHPVNGFELYDTSAVFVGTSLGNALVTDSRAIAEHVDLLARLRALALWGEDARRLLHHLADEYRTTPPALVR